VADHLPKPVRGRDLRALRTDRDRLPGERTSGRRPDELPRELLGEQKKKALERDGILGINRAVVDQ